MSQLTNNNFLKTLPDTVISHLPQHLQTTLQVRQPWRWLMQFHVGEPRLHYEVSKAVRRPGWELGFHFEARDKELNRFLLDGFRRHLFEIKDTLGESMEAEMWDRGWTKIYEVFPEEPLSTMYQARVGRRLADIIVCLHPIFVDLRAAVRMVHR